MSVKKQAISGFFWAAIERLGQLFLQAVLFVVLARLLNPEDFGLVAMIMVFFAVSQSFIDSGMGQALIREKEITDQDRSTVFWFNMLLSILFYGLLFVTAPLVAAFYNQPPLVSLIRVMGLSVIFYGLGIVQRAELTQTLNFKTQAYATLPAFAIAGLASVFMAYQGFGVWSLVTQYLLLSVFSTVFLWLLCPTRLLFVWSHDSFRRLFGFGYKLLLSGLLNTFYLHAYPLIIGKFFSAAVLGFYIQAQKMRDLIAHGLMSVIDKVSYPLLSKAANGIDTVRLKENYRLMIKSSSFIVFPCILILMLLAKPIIVYVLGDEWLSAAPYLQLLCIHGMLYHLHAINLNVLKVLGRSDLFLKLEIIKKINITIAIIVGVPFGIYGLLFGQVISSYIALLINCFYTVKLLRYTYVEQFKDIFAVLLLSVPMLGFIYVFEWVFDVNSLSVLVLCLIGAIISYVVSNLIIRSSTTQFILGALTPYLSLSLKKKSQ